jgi:hypothetical protein
MSIYTFLKNVVKNKNFDDKGRLPFCFFLIKFKNQKDSLLESQVLKNANQIFQQKEEAKHEQKLKKNRRMKN